MSGLRGQGETYADWRFLGDHVSQYDVVIAELETSWVQMSFGGKSVASIHPVHWVEDDLLRRETVNEFFSGTTADARKAEILGQYCVGYILLRQAESSPALTYDDLASEVYRNESFILLKVDQDLLSQRCVGSA